MIKGTTKTGFKYSIDPQVMDDFELIEYISQVEDNPILYPKLCEKLLGSNQKEKLINHVKALDENGVAKISLINQELEDIFNNQTTKK